MKWGDLLRLNLLKTTILFLTFAIIFFINIPALSQPCNFGNFCPDFIEDDLVGLHPNFLVPERCGGVGGKCSGPYFSKELLAFDIILWIIINLIAFSLISKSRK